MHWFVVYYGKNFLVHHLLFQQNKKLHNERLCMSDFNYEKTIHGFKVDISMAKLLTSTVRYDTNSCHLNVPALLNVCLHETNSSRTHVIDPALAHHVQHGNSSVELVQGYVLCQYIWDAVTSKLTNRINPKYWSETIRYSRLQILKTNRALFGCLTLVNPMIKRDLIMISWSMIHGGSKNWSRVKSAPYFPTTHQQY